MSYDKVIVHHIKKQPNMHTFSNMYSVSAFKVYFEEMSTPLDLTRDSCVRPRLKFNTIYGQGLP